MIEKTRADVGAPGYYFDCKSDIQQTGTSLTAPILCYVDSPGVTVNPSAASGLNSCATPPATPQPGVTADPKYCGDGLPGASPPGCNSVSLGTSACEPLAPNCQGGIAITSPCNISQYQFAHVGSQHTTLTGTLDTSTHTVGLSGCFQDLSQLGNVYLRVKTNAYTGIGIGNLYTGQTIGNCTGGTPTGSANFVKISAVRQAPGSENGCTADGSSGITCRDSDGDGCPDKDELQSPQIVGFAMTGTVMTNGTSTLTGTGSLFPTELSAGATVGDIIHVPGETARTVVSIASNTSLTVNSPFTTSVGGLSATADEGPLSRAKRGGLRDPMNRFDYPDMPTGSNQHKIRTDDVTYVVNRYRHDQGGTVAPLYDARADHTVLPGNNPGEVWHLGPPNGQIRVDDITAVNNQYRHDCA